MDTFTHGAGLRLLVNAILSLHMCVLCKYWLHVYYVGGPAMHLNIERSTAVSCSFYAILIVHFLLCVCVCLRGCNR